METKKERAPWVLMTLFAGIVLVLLVLVLLGCRGYTQAVARQTENQNSRAALSYIATRVRASDNADAVQLGEGPEGTALVLCDITDTATYETRIYLYEGTLVEEYAAQGSIYDPQNAVAVAETDSFAATLKDGLLQCELQQGTVQVALRAGGAA